MGQPVVIVVGLEMSLPFLAGDLVLEVAVLDFYHPQTTAIHGLSTRGG